MSTHPVHACMSTHFVCVYMYVRENSLNTTHHMKCRGTMGAFVAKSTVYDRHPWVHSNPWIDIMCVGASTWV